MKLSIRTWTEPFPHSEGVAVVFDVFRCSTTIHTLVSRKIGPVFVSPALKTVQREARVQKMRVFSELSQPVDCLERFDNSPHHALIKPWEKDVPALVATTTGTPAMFTAKNFERVYVGSLVNFSALVKHLAASRRPITLIPATFPDAKHVEDNFTAEAVATALAGLPENDEFLRECAKQALEKIHASGRPEFLAKKLETGLDDVTLAMEVDRFPQLLALEFEGDLFAKVVTL